MRWGQKDLACEISKHGVRAKVKLAPDQRAVSRWERGAIAPSPLARMALARIAMKYKHEDLAQLFRAPVSAWRLVGHVKFGLRDEK